MRKLSLRQGGKSFFLLLMSFFFLSNFAGALSLRIEGLDSPYKKHLALAWAELIFDTQSRSFGFLSTETPQTLRFRFQEGALVEKIKDNLTGVGISFTQKEADQNEIVLTVKSVKSPGELSQPLPPLDLNEASSFTLPANLTKQFLKEQEPNNDPLEMNLVAKNNWVFGQLINRVDKDCFLIPRNQEPISLSLIWLGKSDIQPLLQVWDSSWKLVENASLLKKIELKKNPLNVSSSGSASFCISDLVGYIPYETKPVNPQGYLLKVE